MSDDTDQNEPDTDRTRSQEAVGEGESTRPSPRDLTEHHVGALREWLESPLEYPRTTDPWVERADDFMSRNFSDDEVSPLDYPRIDERENVDENEFSDPQDEASTPRFDGETGEPLVEPVDDVPKRRAEDFQDWFADIEELPPGDEASSVGSMPERDLWTVAELPSETSQFTEPAEAEDLPAYPQDEILAGEAVHEPEAWAGKSETDGLPAEEWMPEPEVTAAAADETPFGFVNDAPYEPPFVPVAYVPDAPDETVRRSGLAWSSGIAFFGSVAFMLFLGWLADLLLGTSPWGVVGGIILGSIIGFVQFFQDLVANL